MEREEQSMIRGYSITEIASSCFCNPDIKIRFSLHEEPEHQLIELDLPSAISTPECPPLSPFATYGMLSFHEADFLQHIFLFALTSMPPAQPT